MTEQIVAQNDGVPPLAGACAVVLECVLVATLAVAALEGLSRLMHGLQRPMLPHVTDAAQGARMPARFDSKVHFPGGESFHVCTDDNGLRSAACRAPAQVPAVLAAGDSQVLGWGLAFEDTFTARVAGALGAGAPGQARVMAAGGADVESLLPWARDVKAALPAGRSQLKVVVVNLGNDLDEMYFGRSSGTVARAHGLREWLATHSYFMLDFTLAKNALMPGAEWSLPPGANPVTRMLPPAERRQLARAAADAALRLARALPDAERTVVLLLPNDYQVAATEFDKCRRFYPDAEQFESWRRRVGESTAALDDIQRVMQEHLQHEPVRVVAPLDALRQLDPVAVFDRSSHHYTRYGQEVLARAILKEIQP